MMLDEDEKIYDPLTLAQKAYNIAIKAGELVLKKRNEALNIQAKADGSPATIADTASEEYICKALTKITPDIPIVAEERVARGEVCLDLNDDQPFWLVDPLDGTKDFIAGEAEFAINIALISENTPILGIIHAPALEETYIGLVGNGATKVHEERADDMHCRVPPAEGLTIISSRRHGSEPLLDEYLANFTIAQHKRMSSAIKFGHIANGDADIYPRFGRVMGWDLAAGHAIILAAGGRVTTATGAAPNYRTEGFYIPSFIARGRLQS